MLFSAQEVLKQLTRQGSQYYLGMRYKFIVTLCYLFMFRPIFHIRPMVDKCWFGRVGKTYIVNVSYLRISRNTNIPLVLLCFSFVTVKYFVISSRYKCIFRICTPFNSCSNELKEKV